ncbi:MAG: hypothetical protein A3J81_05715 [Nitrospirae bacterium RIFOXYB2_FULL_43_5]|nr:MAG: hypothetical protein A2X54_07200 [Nitrospirae bacterium GWF2_44_13]OGW64423.1 MAG: hypothetical protein A2222_01685 [Nitrospirae bacterium RIFOXYA2_FULL_44_9]OGW72719.1 MAG: hypothetical protein A2484_03030 [Nitrospirae bacterium RIFOXYC2_FULL_44_7]OGW76832.1 MAG: hypothetical protein A3J81_05715 [Nitrospirae bacterium RIFOXYB2_FULL_43_5]HBG92403.1 hypothetical protein [Nitrospiraceae bacterium]
MPISHHREKLLNAIIYFANNTKYCGKTKLYKLLFYLDFTHFKETGHSVTELDYFVWEHGPAPKNLHKEFAQQPKDIQEHVTLIGSSDSFIGVKARKKFDEKHFTKRELRILKNLCDIFRDAKAEHMVEASHEIDKPWDITNKTNGMHALIDYFLALDNSPGEITKEEAKERIRDKEQLESAFK